MSNEKLKNIYDKITPLVFLSFIMAIAITTLKYPDPDSSFLIKTGEYIVQNKTVPTTNPFVIHEGLEIIIQQWLFDVIMYEIYSTMSYLGLFLYSMCIMIVSMFVMYKFFGFYTQDKRTKIIFLGIYLIIGYSFFRSRPTSISFLMCLLTIMIMEKYSRTNNHKLLFWLPIISLFTVNVHSSIWPMLFVLMLPFVCPDIFELTSNKQDIKTYIINWIKKQKWVLFTMFIMILVGFINPNGIRGMMYVFLSYGSATKNDIILELKKPEILSTTGSLIIVELLCLILYIKKNKDNLSCRIIYMTLGTIFLACMHIRNMWFISFSFFPLILILFPNLFEKQKDKKLQRSSTYIYNIIASLMMIAFCVLGPIFLFPLQPEDNALTPISAAEYLKDKQTENIVLYTDFNNGAYMELQGYKVYIDARPELFQKSINGKENIYDEYLDLNLGKSDYQKFLDKYNFTHMLIEKKRPLEAYIRNHNSFKLVVDHKEYVLYEINNFGE